MPSESPIMHEDGENIDPSVLITSKNKHIPTTRQFKLVKYYNPRTSRWAQVFICCHEDCMLTFKKWHSLFDHLRVHTNERPYQCIIKQCNKSFA